MSHLERPASIPPFPPIRPRHRACRLRRALRSHHALGAALALTAALLTVLSLSGAGQPPTESAARATPAEPSTALTPDTAAPPPDTPPPAQEEPPEGKPPEGSAAPDPPTGKPPAGGEVTVAVRIADPGTVQLLTPGDVVDVVAAAPVPPEASATTAQTRRLAHRARVAEIPPPPRTGQIDPMQGALVVLAVSPATAAALIGAAADSRLAVTKW